ncbi:hypothetical protein D3C81_2139450 [compost metagenome]
MVILNPRGVTDRLIIFMNQIGMGSTGKFLIPGRFKHVERLVHALNILLRHIVRACTRIRDYLMLLI